MDAIDSVFDPLREVAEEVAEARRDLLEEVAERNHRVPLLLRPPPWGKPVPTTTPRQPSNAKCPEHRQICWPEVRHLEKEEERCSGGGWTVVAGDFRLAGGGRRRW